MKVNDITLVNKGTLYPVDEATLRRIDITQYHDSADFKTFLVAVLKAIIDYNKQWATDKDKQFRIFYSIKTANSFLTPNFERLICNDTTLLVSVDGESVKRHVMLEALDLDIIQSIASDLFDYTDFADTIDYNLDSGNNIKKNINAIRDMYKEWCSTSNNDKGHVTLFMEHLDRINEMKSYNAAKFYEEKRNYLNFFLDFLDNRIENINNCDGSLTTNELKEIKKFYES